MITHIRRILAGAAMVIASMIIVSSPAAATGHEVTATSKSECGFVLVTVVNPLDFSVGYFVTVAAVSNHFEVGAQSSRVHRVRVPDGGKLLFRPFVFSPVVPADFPYLAPEGCPAGKVDLDLKVSCTNAMITVSNSGLGVAPDVLITINNRVVSDGPIQPGGKVLELSPKDTDAVLVKVLQRGAVPSSDDLYQLITRLEPYPDCAGHTVAVTDTCDGIRLNASVPAGPNATLSVHQLGTGLAPTFDVPPPGLEFETPVPAGALLSIQYNGQPVSALHRHTVPASCVPTQPPSSRPPVSPPTTPAESPPPVSGGGGGLPLTGVSTSVTILSGVGLLAIGALTVLLARRRLARYR